MISSVLKIIQGIVKLRNSSGTIIDPAIESTQVTQNTRIGDLTESAPGTDTASSGLNGRLQRIAQRLTDIIALLPQSYSHKRVSGATTVTVKSGAGVLKRITINRQTNGKYTVYDNTAGSGTVLAIISSVNGVSPVTLDYELAFSTGLTVVTTGANTDLSFIYT